MRNVDTGIVVCDIEATIASHRQTDHFGDVRSRSHIGTDENCFAASGFDFTDRVRTPLGDVGRCVTTTRNPVTPETDPLLIPRISPAMTAGRTALRLARAVASPRSES